MNFRCGILPNLNSCYMQMKAFEQHRKKIEQIKRSRSQQKTKMKPKVVSQSLDEEKDIHVQRDNLVTIKQQLKKELRRQLSPRANQNKYEIRKENHRLLERIHNCSPTINRRAIERHEKDSRRIKELLCRFQQSPLSHKVVLKCKQSLQILRKRQFNMQKSLNSASRDPSRIRYAKSQASRIQTYGSDRKQSNSSSKKSSIKKFYLLKDPSKIKKFFQKSDQHENTKKFETLKFNFWSCQRKSIKTDVRQPCKIFQTEIQC